VINTRVILPAVLVFAVSGYSQADDLTDAAQALCDSVKTCALEQVASQNVSAEEMAKMGPLLDNMCANMRSQVQDVPADHKLYQPAVRCMRSMVSLDCQQMQTPESAKTAECTEYEKLAVQAPAPQP
jgi:hypothetical protein